LGNVELHLIKGEPVVHTGDNLIVSHISVETDNIEAVLEKLIELKVPFSRNVSVPDASETKPITQYFIRDPDGYYIELCNCNILTNFCLGKDKCGIAYSEIVENVDLSHVFKLAFLAQQIRESYGDDSHLVLPEDQWATEVDAEILANMLSRCKIYGDLMQGETSESISSALKKANNEVPRATRIIRAAKKGREIMIPPAFYEQGESRYQPKALLSPKGKGDTSQPTTTEKKDSSFETIIQKTFESFDINKDGVLSKDEIRKLLFSLRQDPTDGAFAKLFNRDDTNGDGVIDLEEFITLVKNQPPLTETAQWEAFFKLLDIDGNGKITSPELCMVVREIGLALEDGDIENIFIEADLNGDGSLTINELKLLMTRDILKL